MDAPERKGGAERAGPTELPEHIFRRGEDWAWLKAARRERRREETKARLAALMAPEYRAWIVAALAPLVVLGVAWLVGAVR